MTATFLCLSFTPDSELCLSKSATNVGLQPVLFRRCIYDCLVFIFVESCFTNFVAKRCVHRQRKPLCKALSGIILPKCGSVCVFIVFSRLNFAGKCFQFPLQVNRVPAFLQRKWKSDSEAVVPDEDEESVKSSRDPETHYTYTSSRNSDIESPPGVPIMSLQLPTPNPTPPLLSPTPGKSSVDVSTYTPEKRRSLPLRLSPLTNVSNLSPNCVGEAESLLKEVTSSPSKTGNMLYIPELKGRITSAASESSLWNSRKRSPWLDTGSVDFRGSTVLTSPVINMQQLVQPKKTEKVAQVFLFSFAIFLRSFERRSEWKLIYLHYT